jgi:uncharacterized protein YjbI with pentapeptide repeats
MSDFDPSFNKKYEESPVYQLWQSLRNASFIQQQPLHEPNVSGTQTANFQGQDLRGSLFKFKNVTHSSFFGADLTGCVFRECTLNHADLSHAMLLGTQFINVIVEEACFDYADLTGVVLESSHYHSSSFIHTQIRDCNATFAQFNYANFTHSDLSSSDFSGTDLTNACLQNACLKDTNLQDATLIDTDLYGAYLSSNCNLTAKQLSKAKNLAHIIVDPEDKHMLSILEIARVSTSYQCEDFA